MTPAPTGFQGDLRTLLLSLPAAATVTTGPSAPPDGLIDIENAAAGANVPPSRMREAGFVKGAIGEWIESDGTWVGIFLYQFNEPIKAEQWANAVRDGFESSPVFPAGVPIAGVPSGMVYARDTISDNGRWFAEAVFARNAISVELFVTGPVRHDPQKTIDYAVAQFARLP